MTPTTPIDQIAQMLTDVGYRRLTMPFAVAGLMFEFPAAFVGTPPAPDLVLVADTAFDAPARILSKIEGLARALDVVRSKRPLTAVLAGPRPSTSVLDAMTKVCRVLPVGTVIDPSDQDPVAALTNWLAILLPLTIPEPARRIADPIIELVSYTSNLDRDVVALIEIAASGTDAVQGRLHYIIEDALGSQETQS